MTALIVAVAIIFAAFGGAILCAIGVFLWRLLSSVNQLQATAEVFFQSIEPLIKEHSPKQIAEDLRQLKIVGAKILFNFQQSIPVIEGLTEAFNGFHSTLTGMQAEPAKPRATTTRRTPAEAVASQLPTRFETPEGFAKEGESGAFHYTEEEAATREAVAVLRQRGIEVDASNVTEPTTEEMKGAEA